MRIKLLEDGLGVKLLYRTSQGVRLTPSGETFVQHARVVLSQIQHLQSDLLDYASGAKGRLRLWVNTTAMEFIPDVLRIFLSTHKEVDVEMRERPSFEIVGAIVDGRADVGVVAGDVVAADVKTMPYRTERLVLVTSASHPFANRRVASFEETLDFLHINLSEPSAIHRFLMDAARNAGRILRLRIEVANFETACRMIEADAGVGVIPESAARRSARTLGIHIAELSDVWAVRNLKICVRRDAPLPGFARELLSLLQESTRTPQEA